MYLCLLQDHQRFSNMSRALKKDDKNTESSYCQVVFEYSTPTLSALEFRKVKPRISKIASADVFIQEQEKILLISDSSREDPETATFSLRDFMLFNGQVDMGRIGLRMRESKFNPKDVLILISSTDVEYIRDINRGILASQGRKTREKCTPIASPNKWSPDLKKLRPRNTPIPSPLGEGSVPTRRFGFGRELQSNSISDRLRSPQLKCKSSKKESLPPVDTSELLNLSTEQRDIVKVVLSGESIFFTGGGGTGKSFLLKKLIALLPPKSTAVTASTGIAACHIDGITLHQFLGIGRIDPYASGVAGQILARLRKSPEKMETIRRTKVLIIDEISLIDSKLFELVHETLSGIRNSAPSSAFFGGIQLVLSGDFLQLPPVPHQTDSGSQKQAVKFCFESKIWRKAVKKSFHLTQIFRQSDTSFASMLNEIRFGKCSEKTARLLLERVKHSLQSDSNTLKLLPLNREVIALNEQELSKLPRGVPKQTFSAIDTVFDLQFSPDSVCPVKSTLTLTVGCRVILLVTLSVSEKLVNGSVGTVVKFSASPSIPYVKIDGLSEPIGVPPHDWVFKQSGKEVARRRQIPLSLAWGVSIHKSQGMTLAACEVSLDRIFEAGQAYVALSRCTTLESLRIISNNPQGLTVNNIKRCIRANPICVDFYRKFFPN